MRISFTKMQGLGNDFVVIDNITHDVLLSKELICKIADRNFGVGCDQILILEAPPATVLGVDFIYRVFNADGSEANQCGNGIRCLAKLVVAKGLSQKEDLVFATESCRTKTHLEADGQVTVTIGAPIFEPQSIPFVAEKVALRYNLLITGYGEIGVGAVSVGNPHAVIVVDDVDTAPLEVLGPLVAKSAYFPEGTNVNFMQILERNQIKLRVYERGSGETLACGSGACASMVLGRYWGLLEPQVRVKLLGGDLLIKWDRFGDDIQMTGPAETVFVGEIFG